MKNLNRFLIEIFASFTFLCLAFPSLATGAPFAYITNSGSNSVSVIDTATNTVIATVAVGFNPWGVAVHPDGSRVYVAKYSQTVSVIDTATNTVVGTVQVGTGPAAFGNFIGPAATNSLAFLSFPLSVDCAGNPCNPYTAMISSVMDHSGTPLDLANPGAWYSRDGKVKAFNGELGETVFGVNCSPGPGYKNQDGTDFLSSMNYVGARCSSKKKDQENEENKFPEHFLNYDGHSGYDYPYPALITPIVAPADGKLFKATTDSVNHNSKCNFNGWNEWHTFYIDHENEFTTWYLHADQLAPEIERQIGKDFTKFVIVKKGQTVGFVGNYAKCSKVGAHLHFEVRRGLNEVVDPYEEGLWEATP